MDKVIRISDQRIFKSVSAAAVEIGTPYNYLSKCIQNGKLCKGELYEYYNEYGLNTTAEEYQKRIDREIKLRELSEQTAEQEKRDKEFQKVLKFMKSRAEALNISLDEYCKDFVKHMTERDMLS